MGVPFVPKAIIEFVCFQSVAYRTSHVFDCRSGKAKLDG
jgi:hypothetical protein